MTDRAEAMREAAAIAVDAAAQAWDWDGGSVAPDITNQVAVALRDIAAAIRALALPPRPTVEEVAWALAHVYEDPVSASCFEKMPTDWKETWLAVARRAMEML